MQQLNLNENNNVEVKIESENRFWRRQFQKDATHTQIKFDWIFGAILPVICFVFDPIVFKGYGLGKGALMGSYKPFAYLLSFVSVMAMSAWLIWGAKLKWLNAFLAGLFLVSGLVSLSIGIVLIPISLIGLIIAIGALGFTPLFCSIVFFRNAFRAFQTAKPFFENSVLIRSFALAAIFSAVVPAIINREINEMLNEIVEGNVQTIRENAQILKFVSPLVDVNKLGGKYCYLPDDERHKVLAEVYEQFTGESIERIDFHICEDW